MKNRSLLVVVSLVVAGAILWFARRPSAEDVIQLEGKLVRAICETDIAHYYESKVGTMPIQSLVGPPSSTRD